MQKLNLIKQIDARQIIPNIQMEENIKETVEKIVAFISKYRSQRYIEYEVRLGRVGDAFDSTIGKRHYQLIVDQLNELVSENGQKIEAVNSEYIVEYDINNRRKIDDIVIEKTRLGYVDFEIKNSPVDIRISVSKEQPVKKFGSPISTLKKKRTSWTYKNWKYDLTVTDDSKYSVEIEMDIKKIPVTGLNLFVYSTLMKIQDLSLILEKESKPGEFILVSEQ